MYSLRPRLTRVNYRTLSGLQGSAEMSDSGRNVDDSDERKYGRVRNISEIKVNNEPISSAAEMAEVFNDFFATIGSNLASEIQPSTIEPEFYLQPTDNIFS